MKRNTFLLVAISVELVLVTAEHLPCSEYKREENSSIDISKAREIDGLSVALLKEVRLPDDQGLDECWSLCCKEDGELWNDKL